MSLLGRDNDAMRTSSSSGSDETGSDNDDEATTLFDIAIDPYARRLYNTDRRRNAIMVMDMSERYDVIGAVVSGGDEDAQRPRHLAVDAVSG